MVFSGPGVRARAIGLCYKPQLFRLGEPMNPAEQIVLIGVAQQTWKDRDRSRTPVDALQAVATQALSDSGSEKVIGSVDAMVHVPFLLNQVPEMAAAMPRNPGASR